VKSAPALVTRASRGPFPFIARKADGGVAAPPSSRDAAGLHGSSWLVGFVVFEIACQLILVSPWGERARVLVRTGAFAASFLLLFVLRRSGDNHPAWRMAIAAVLVVAASILHPDTNSVGAGMAAVVLYLAVFAPIFWVPRIRIGAETVYQVFFLLWAFNTASALFGVLQIYFPDRFQPTLSNAIAANDLYVEALKIELADGTRVFRPMGLTNGPGGAAIGAAFSVLLSVGFLLSRPRPWFRAVLFVAIPGALFTLYLSQVRAFVVVTALSLLALGVPFAAQRRIGRFISYAVPLLGGGFLVFLLAASVGGEAVTGRLSTLVESNPANVYYNTRGLFLRYTFTDAVPQYPLGAGLGRWGPIGNYFSDSRSSALPLGAEIQWTGWLFDGGVALMIVCAAALWIALRTSLRLAVREDGPSGESLQKWATIVFGYSVGVIALTLDAPPFHSTLGIDFWLANATVFAASHQIAGAGVRRD
jgi:hypothetical protein